MSPIHIRADPTDLAPIALLVGDSGRAHRIAERLDRPQLYNDFRGLIGYTGDFDGTPNSVQTTGMGGPSAALVLEELAQLGCAAGAIERHGRRWRSLAPGRRPPDQHCRRCRRGSPCATYSDGDPIAPACA